MIKNTQILSSLVTFRYLQRHISENTTEETDPIMFAWNSDAENR
jgi:hypothetical protein